jgi:hypothetical protein
MNASPDGNSKLLDAADDRSGARKSRGRCVQGRQEAVTGRIDLATSESAELFSHDGVMPREEFAPGMVANGGQALGRRRNISK